MSSEKSPFATRGDDTWAQNMHESDYRLAGFLAAFKPRSDPKYKVILKNPERPVGIALFGACGRAGNIHLLNILNERRGRLLYIIEEKMDECKRIMRLLNMTEPRLLSSGDSDIVYKDERVDLVIICTPTFLHEQIVKASIEHGKSVFCEKPISATLEGTRNCYKLAKVAGVPLFAAFNRRFDPGFSSIHSRVLAGELGEVRTIKTTSRDSPLPSLDYLAISGKIYHDCAVHDIDIICWILGEYPTKVYTSANAKIPEIGELGDVDTVAIILTFRSGALGIIDLDRNSVYGYDQRLEVLGSKGMLKCENEIPNQVTAFKKDGNTTAPIYYSFPSRHSEGYKIELSHIIDVLQGYEKLSISGEEVLAVSRIADACEESLATNKSVELNWDNWS